MHKAKRQEILSFFEFDEHLRQSAVSRRHGRSRKNLPGKWPLALKKMIYDFSNS